MQVHLQGFNQEFRGIILAVRKDWIIYNVVFFFLKYLINLHFGQKKMIYPLSPGVIFGIQCGFEPV